MKTNDWLIKGMTKKELEMEKKEAIANALNELSANCLRCEYMHKDGNCLKVGGFCTSVRAYDCPKLKELLDESKQRERGM